MEIYKDVIGHEGFYKVSDLGNVKSLSRVVDYTRSVSVRPERILKKTTGKIGYEYVTFSVNKIRITKKIHRLVAEAFLPNLDNKPQVNHINGIKTDNLLSNLEWNTAKENIKHCYKIGLKKGIRGNKSHLSKLDYDQVCLIRVEYAKGFLSQQAIAVKYSISRSQVNRIVNNKNWF